MATVATPRPSETPSTSSFARWTPSIPTNLVNMFNPFASATSTTADENGGSTTERSKSSEQSRSAKLSAATGNKGPPSPSRNSSVMFAEPETRSTSESGSREGSIDGSRRIKRSNRAKTSFSICHPPPTSTTRSKLHRRPRSLLQLHRLSARSRPLPAFEVIPSANFSVRLNRAITRVFKARHGLCVNDLVVFKAEKYNADEEDDEHETRDVIGLICKGRKDEEKSMGNKMRIHMASGREWEAYPTTVGGYEFFTTDEHGLALTLRWVPKRNKDGSRMTMKDGSRRFNFSTISSGSRRHPVIATLSKTGLDIYDSYKLPDGSISTPLSTPQQVTTFLGDVLEEEEAGGEQAPDHCATDDALREIITMTAIWVSFKEGWSPSFRYDSKDASNDMSLQSGSSPSKSTPLLGDISSPPGSPFLVPSEKRASIKSIGSGIVRRASLLSKGTPNQRASTFSIGDDYTPEQSPSRSPSVNRLRADSTSTVLVQRATSNSRRN
ncbi:uncharacterized protein K489DRAFT_306050, partial [Dissoconium aciculare CBS 342.82]|uniref:Uncharacterized protein n=1 Tax=Dissoconium aciculare CBS 342.82 TaxID=1314786 RepID=A0A6J3M3U4_9PEZI